MSSADASGGMHLVVPSVFSGKSLHTIWTVFNDAARCSMSSSTTNRTMVVDLSGVRFFDAEGANYLALMPTALQSAGAKVSVIFPRDGKVLSHMKRIELLPYLESHFSLASTDDTTALLRSHSGHVEPLMRRFPPMLNSIIVSPGPRLVAEDYATLRSRVMRLSLSGDASHRVGKLIIELLTNVLEHSGGYVGAFTLQVLRRSKSSPKRNVVVVAVSDLGVGVQATLKERFHATDPAMLRTLPGRSEDERLLAFAMGRGVSRTMQPQRGIGLHVCASTADKFRLASGEALVAASKQGTALRTYPMPCLAGTSAIAEVQWLQNMG